MKKQLIAIAAAAAIAPVAANAAEVTWSGDFDVTGYSVDAATAGADDTKAYDQVIRLKTTIKGDGNVSLNTRLIISNSSWLGDRRAANAAGSNSGNSVNFNNLLDVLNTAYPASYPSPTGVNSESNQANSDNISLDYGYLQFPIAGVTFRVGRQMANWGHQFLTGDDRRDRILAMKKFGAITAIGLIDKRQEGLINSDDDDGNMYAGALVGVTKGWLWGVLAATWDGDATKSGGYVLDDLFCFSPFFKGKIGPVQVLGTLNVLSGNGRTNTLKMGGADPDRGGLWANDSIAFFIKAAYDFGPAKIEGQVAMVTDGGLVDPTWDSFSMLINNNPRNNPSSVSLVNLGGSGTDGDDQSLYALRVSGKVMEKFDVSGSIGAIDLSNDIDENGTSETFIDLQANYNVTKATKINFGYGKIMGTLGEDSDGVADRGAMRLGVSSTF